MKVIVGAGPAGLYTAIRLRQYGIKNIVVVDPRAGVYTRPGNLNGKIFHKIETGMGRKFWEGKDVGPIKDLERGLYNIAKSMGVKFENKHFVRFNKGKKPKVVISDGQTETTIPADYVFDCTGSKRTVIKEVNHEDPTHPFNIKSLTDITVPDHLAAYIKMDEKYLHAINTSDETLAAHLRPLEYAQLLSKLHEQGWKEFKLPHCYAFPVAGEKGKVMLYLQTPPNLSQVEHKVWLDTYLQSVDQSITYTELPPPRKYKSKPRFTPFAISANTLEKTSYQGDDLPTVIALGDAQIDANFSVGHGIEDGIDRINKLFSAMQLFGGEIRHFDAEGYHAAIATDLSQHARNLIFAEKLQKTKFERANALAEVKLQQALIEASDKDQIGIQELLNKLEQKVKHPTTHLKTFGIFAADATIPSTDKPDDPTTSKQISPKKQ